MCAQCLQQACSVLLGKLEYCLRLGSSMQTAHMQPSVVCEGAMRRQVAGELHAGLLPDMQPHPEVSMFACMCAQNTSEAFFIQYGTGAVLGSVIYETLTLARPPIRVQSQGMGLALDTTAAFYSASCDGLFVRCPSTLSQTACIRGAYTSAVVAGAIERVQWSDLLACMQGTVHAGS